MSRSTVILRAIYPQLVADMMHRWMPLAPPSHEMQPVISLMINGEFSASMVLSSVGRLPQITPLAGSESIAVCTRYHHSGANGCRKSTADRLLPCCPSWISKHRDSCCAKPMEPSWTLTSSKL